MDSDENPYKTLRELSFEVRTKLIEIEFHLGRIDYPGKRKYITEANKMKEILKDIYIRVGDQNG